jgi:hypothetical protein
LNLGLERLQIYWESFITEITENGEPFINSLQFQPDFIKDAPKTSAQKNNQKVKPKNETNTKLDNFSIADLIKKQLDKNNEFVKIYIDIPVLKKDLYEMLADTHEEILDDLTKIVVSKYINKENIEELIKAKMKSYYSGDEDFEKTEVINVEQKNYKLW